MSLLVICDIRKGKKELQVQKAKIIYRDRGKKTWQYRDLAEVGDRWGGRVGRGFAEKSVITPEVWNFDL